MKKILTLSCLFLFGCDEEEVPSPEGCCVAYDAGYAYDALCWDDWTEDNCENNSQHWYESMFYEDESCLSADERKSSFKCYDH